MGPSACPSRRPQPVEGPSADAVAVVRQPALSSLPCGDRLVAADLLIEDQDVAELSKNEDLDYFSFCSSLYATPELMSFKLYSLMKRGQAYHMPMEINSGFLAK